MHRGLSKQARYAARQRYGARGEPCGLARLMTVYELEGPVTSRETYQRCLTYLNGVNTEIETQIRLTWPSQVGRLRAEGLL